MIRASPLLTTYGAPVDRVWACELLRGKPASTQPAPGAANDWGNHGAGQTQRRPAPKLRESAPSAASGVRRRPVRRPRRNPHRQHRPARAAAKGGSKRSPAAPHVARQAASPVGSATRSCAGCWGRYLRTALKQGGLTPKIEVRPPLLASMSISRYHHHYRLHGWWVSIYPDATELRGPFVSVADQIAVAGRRAARLSLRLS
jgi:hypothetical protein